MEKSKLINLNEKMSEHAILTQEPSKESHDLYDKFVNFIVHGYDKLEETVSHHFFADEEKTLEEETTARDHEHKVIQFTKK